MPERKRDTIKQSVSNFIGRKSKVDPRQDGSVRTNSTSSPVTQQTQSPSTVKPSPSPGVKTAPDPTGNDALLDVQPGPTPSDDISALQPPTFEERKSFFNSHPNLVCVIEGTLKLGSIAADASNVPFLKTAVEALITFEKFAKGVSEHRDKCEELFKAAETYTTGLVEILQISPINEDLPTSALFAKFVRRFMTVLKETTNTIIKTKTIMRTSGVQAFAKELSNQGQIASDIQRCMGALDSAQKQFNTLNLALTTSNVENILSQLLLAQSKWAISQIPYIKAGYNEDTKIKACHPNTRTRVRGEIVAWASSKTISLSTISTVSTVSTTSIGSTISAASTTSTMSTTTASPAHTASPTVGPSSRILLLRASAGSGKSTISKSTAQSLEHEGLLAGSFFFSRDVEARNRADNVYATLANQFAIRHAGYASALTAVVKHPNYIPPTDPVEQLNQLLVNPLNELLAKPSATTAPPSVSDGPFVFVLDALDECGDDQGRTLLCDLLTNIESFPPQVRFLLTSRPETPLISQFSELDQSCIHIIDIDETEHVNAALKDIFEYLLTRLRTIRRLSNDDIKRLATASDGLFQFAATVVDLIMDAEEQGYALDMVEDILANQQSNWNAPCTKSPVGILNDLYDTVLKKAFYGSRNRAIPRLSDKIFPRYREVVGAIVYAREPLSIATLAVLVDRSEEEISFALRPLSSVILLPAPDDLSLPVRIRHLSFIEYVTNPAGKLLEKHSELVINNRMEGKLAMNALSIMNNKLCFNISNISSSFTLSSELSQDHINDAISPPLAYSCRFIGSHLERAPLEMELSISLVITFMEKNLLFWLEVLSVLRAMNTAAHTLITLAHRLKAIKPAPSTSASRLKDLVNDAVRFVRYFGPAIARSAPHTYLSTLPFAPSSSPIAQLYASSFQNMITLEIGRLLQWPANQMVLQGHASSVTSVAFSPDGARVVSGSWDNTIRIWDAATGETVAEPFEGHTSTVTSVAFSPDGARVVSGSGDNTIRIWDAATGETVAGPFEGHTSTVTSVAFSPDGARVVSGSYDNTIRIWDAATGDTVAEPFEGHTSTVSSVAFSPDGARVVSGSYDDTIRIWDAATGETVAGPFEGHRGEVSSVAFSPDGARVISGSWDNTIRIWDAATGETVAGPFEGHTRIVSSVAFSPDGARVVSGSYDDTIRIWDAATGETVAGPFEGHRGGVSSVAFSPDGARVVSGSYDDTIRIWDAATGEIVAGPFEGHTSTVTSVAFSPNGAQVISGSEDNTIRIWDAATGETVAGPFEGHRGGVSSVAFSPGGARVVSSSYDDTIRIWDAVTGETVAGPFEGHTSTVTSVAFSPDGARVVSGSYDNTIRIWDAATGETVAGPFEGHRGEVSSVAFSPDGARVISGSWDNTIRIWDAATGETVAGPFEGHRGEVSSVAFSPDGARVISGSWDNTIRIWDAATGETVAGPFEGHTSTVTSVAFSPDGARVVSGSYDNTIRIWDAAAGETVAGPFEGHRDGVTSVAFSPDGARVVSNSEGNTIRITNSNMASAPSLFSDQSTLTTDGWITAPGDQLLFWVPSLHRQSLHRPSTHKVIGPHETRLDSSRVVFGDGWNRCYVP